MSNPIDTLAELIDRHAAEAMVAFGERADLNSDLGHCLRQSLAKAYAAALACALDANRRGRTR